MYKVVTHFDSTELRHDRFISVLFPDRASAQKHLNRAMARPNATDGVVSIALFKENKMIFIYTPITDIELIEGPRARKTR